MQVATETGPPPQETKIRIDIVAMEDGSLNFADFWIQPNYRVGIEQLNGNIVGLSSDRGLARDARPRGQGGPLRARDHRGRR